MTKQSLSIEMRQAARLAEYGRPDQTYQWIEALTHELKTHLTTIVLGVDAMDRKSPYAARMKGAINSITDLLHRVTSEFSGERTPSGVCFQPCNIAQIVDTCIERCASPERIRLKGLNKKEAVIQSDAVLIAVVLNNLLDNALGYSPRRSVIDVSILRERSGISVTVKNDIAAGSRIEFQRIFEKYYRGHQSSGQPLGMGLGLFLARRFAEQIGASLRCTSKPTSVDFELWLPA